MKYYLINNNKIYFIEKNYIKIIEKKFSLILFKILIIFLIFIIGFIINYNKLHDKINLKDKSNDSLIKNNMKYDYDNNKFIIIKKNSRSCGLFGFYVSFIGCIQIFISKGYIPIIDLSSLPNIFNGYNITSIDKNPWEIFFYQPFGYTLKNIIKKGKNIKFFECNLDPTKRPNSSTIFINNILRNFWNNIAENYIPIKKEIINEANNIRINIFKGSDNVLGVLIRGTDYIAKKPKYHPIQPNAEMVLKDTKEMNNKNKYDFIFIATEDDLIRKKFIKEFGDNLKYIGGNKNIEYNYKKKQYLAFNKNIKGNINYLKNYLISVIILSKCIDIICSRTSGSVGVFILNKGFRNKKVYYLGSYK